MRQLQIFIAIFFCFSNANGQMYSDSQLFINETINQNNLCKEELLSKYMDFDFGSLWIGDERKNLGFIGEDFQRIHIKILSAVKNIKESSKYYVYGKTRVKSNICQFIGTIDLIHIRKVNDAEKELLKEEAKKRNDENAIALFSKQEFILLAKYEFFEEHNQKGSGIFNGVLKTNFYIENGRILNDPMEEVGDNFCNNQVVGTWVGYLNSVSKKCNWGEYRIPYSGDLDVGVGEFSPNKKYLSKGWETFYKAYILDDLNSKKEEEFEWWN